MALPQNRKAVQALLNELEPLIIGKERPGMTCNCGAVHCGKAVASAIRPAGDTYPGQEVEWFLWSVQMKAYEGSDWSCGLSFFLGADVLEAMFARYFGNQKYEGDPYKLDVDGSDRVHQKLPLAVRINENENQIRFSFSFGREQEFAKKLIDAYRKNQRCMPSGSDEFQAIVRMLGDIDPIVYRGGPDPELSYESKWHINYTPALETARHVASHIFIQGVGSSADYRGLVYTNCDVVFMKVAVN